MLILAPSCVWAHDGATSSQLREGITVPREVVLLIPPIDRTVDAPKLAPLREQIARVELEYQFLARGFCVIGDGLARRYAISAPAIDLRGAGSGRDRVFAEIARRAGAQWVVGIEVLEIGCESGPANGYLARCRIRIEIWDAAKGGFVLDAMRAGEASQGGPPGWLFLEALRNAVSSSVSDALKAYPVEVEVSRDGAIVDYLKGQVSPFRPTAGSTFSGLGREARSH